MKPRIPAMTAVFTIDDSLARAALYRDNNVFKQFLIRKGHAADAAFDAAFAGAAQVIEARTTRAAGADVHRAAGDDGRVGDGRCYIVGSMQCPYYVHKAMKPLLGCGAGGRRDHAVGDRRRVRRQGRVSIDARRARRAARAQGEPR